MTTEPTITPTLRTLKGASLAPLHELDRETTVLGKLPDCDIVLDQKAVSKRHARIVRRDDGYYLEDLQSRNRTYLNGRVVDRPERLRDGSTIGICDFRFVFEIPTVTVQDEADASSTILGVLDASSTDPSLTAVRPEEKLRALMEINRDLAGTLELKDVLARVLATLFRIFPRADRGFVLLKDERVTELVPSAIQSRQGDPGHLTISRTVFHHVLDQGQAVLSEDAPRQFDDAPSLVAARVRTLMAVPLFDHQRRPAGILQLDTRDWRGKFSAEDLDLLVAVADQISVAVENARLHAIEVRQRALDQEADDARAVQRALLPTQKPTLAGYEFWDHYEPARFVGGDYFDYIPLASTAASTHRWALALGDVSGKGMPAALLMARLSAEVRLLLQTEPDPARVVALLNQELCEAGSAEKFITFLLVVIDGANHRLTVVNAGHMGPIVRRGDGRIEVIGEDQGGLILGIEEGQSYEAADTLLGPGDVVVLYTDGVSEAMNGAGRQFGTEHLEQALASAPAGVGAAGDAILQAVRRHTTGCPQSDDITLLCFGRV